MFGHFILIHTTRHKMKRKGKVEGIIFKKSLANKNTNRVGSTNHKYRNTRCCLLALSVSLASVLASHLRRNQRSQLVKTSPHWRGASGRAHLSRAGLPSARGTDGSIGLPRRPERGKWSGSVPRREGGTRVSAAIRPTLGFERGDDGKTVWVKKL
jgi:hypothetical protein